MQEIIFDKDSRDVELKINTGCSTSYIRIVLTDEGYVVDINAHSIEQQENKGILYEDSMITATYVYDDEVIDIQNEHV